VGGLDVVEVGHPAQGGKRDTEDEDEDVPQQLEVAHGGAHHDVDHTDQQRWKPKSEERRRGAHHAENERRHEGPCGGPVATKENDRNPEEKVRHGASQTRPSHEGAPNDSNCRSLVHSDGR